MTFEKIRPWVDASVKARKQLYGGGKGRGRFVPIGGRTPAGKALLAHTRDRMPDPRNYKHKGAMKKNSK